MIGGDFNTMLDGNQGVENIDLEDRDNIPQKENGKILREWIEEGNFCDPFRTKYPMAHVMSYKPFRTRRQIGDRWETVNYGKSRLDFFIISKELYKDVDSIYYGERLSRDFDHMEAILKIGKSKRKKERIYIRNETLDRPEIDEIGVLGYLDCMANHLQVRDEALQRKVGELEAMYVEKCNIRRGMELGLVDNNEEEMERLTRLEFRWKVKIRELGNLSDISGRRMSCSNSVLYEVLLNEYKNRIVALQGGLDRDRKYKKKWLEGNAKVIKEMFGANSEQYKQCEENILEYDSQQIKEKTDKYIKLLQDNNEKATRKFCSIGKNVSAVDDISQIQKNGGIVFATADERAEHIRKFYENLYKKKIDRLIEIESFFTEREWEELRGNGKKLDEETKMELEGDISMDELEKSLKSSNINSCPGWDGVSYKCIKKLWAYLKDIMLNMANDSFREGKLPESLRTGLIKLIPKGKNSTRVEDWRPITLLPTSYKIISGVIAGRLERTLPHIIGRSQKGFLRHKNMGTVLHNVIDGIANSWEEKEQMGVLSIVWNTHS